MIGKKPDAAITAASFRVVQMLDDSEDCHGLIVKRRKA